MGIFDFLRGKKSTTTGGSLARGGSDPPCFDFLRGKGVTTPSSQTPARQGGAGVEARILYIFTTASLSDATTARLGSDMLKNLPRGTPIPDTCRTVPLQIASGASKDQVERILGAKARKEAGATKSLCIVTSGSDDDVREGFFIGFSACGKGASGKPPRRFRVWFRYGQVDLAAAASAVRAWVAQQRAAGVDFAADPAGSTELEVQPSATSLVPGMSSVQIWQMESEISFDMQARMNLSMGKEYPDKLFVHGDVAIYPEW